MQARARVAYEKEKEKLKEFVSREGKKYDNPAHQSQRKMKLKQLEALVEVESVEEDSELVMIFPTPFGVFDRYAALPYLHLFPSVLLFYFILFYFLTRFSLPSHLSTFVK